MQTLPAEYLAEIARQFSFLSAFLGGFAATFFVTLLVADSPKRSTGWSLGCAAFAASSFVVAAVSFVMITVVLNPEVPANVSSGSSIDHARVVGILGFGLGVYALLASVGISGWIRSRRLGLVTSASAGVGLILVSWAFVGFG